VRRQDVLSIVAAMLCLFARPAAAQCRDLEYTTQISDSVSAMSSENSLVFLGFRMLVEIHDASNPESPFRVGSIPVNGEPTAIEVQDNIIYIATEWSTSDGQTLLVADITDPSMPVVLADLAWPERITDLAASVDRLCILDRWGDITLVDTTSPGQPIFGSQLVGDYDSIEARVNILYATFDVFSAGNYEPRLETIGIANIAAPNPLNTVVLGPSGVDPEIDRSGTLLVASAGNQLVTLSLSTPGNPTITASRGGIRQGATPFLSESNGTVLAHMLSPNVATGVWDVTNPANPVFGADYSNLPDLVAPVGAHSFVWSRTLSLLTAHTLETPAAPRIVWLRSYDSRFYNDETFLVGPNLMVVDTLADSTLFRFVNGANPDSPAVVSTLTVEADVDGIDVTGDLLLFLTQATPDSTTLNIYDVSDPLNPTLLSDSLTWSGNEVNIYNYLYADGRLAVIQLINTYQVIDITDPRRPVVTAIENMNGGIEIDLNDGILTAFRTAGANRLDVINLTDPYNPFLASTINEPTANVVSVRGRLAACLRADNTTALYDFSDPSNPLLRSTLPAPANISELVTVRFAGSMCVLTSEEGWVFYNVGVPANPTFLGELNLPDRSGDTFLVGEYLWAFHGFDGISVVHLPEFGVVTQQPVDRAPCTGATFTLTVNATSASPVSYRWRYNGQLLTNGTNPSGTTFAGAFTRTLTVSNFSPTEIGVYDCRVTNDCGIVLSDAAFVVEGAAPVINDQPRRQEVCPFGTASFSAAVWDAPIATFRWQAEIPFNSGNYFNLGDFQTADYALTGSATDTLTIAALPGRRLPAGVETRYRLVATSTCGTTTSDTARLVVCAADVNCDAFLDFFDYDEFVTAFETGAPQEIADFNADGFIDFFDYDEFVTAFEVGC
jgi:hypothetical protein